ncbi:MAG: Crp/Fnr family transcriptional regulator [Chloroflexi bacterium]|nr:Crp/Fnr family transcriptional regulator [Chloroflexota bacterium]
MPVDSADMRQLVLFADLPDPACAALASIAVREQYTAGKALFFEGDPARGIYILLNGHVRLSRTSLSGREQVLQIVTPGHHFNLVPVFDGGGCPVNAFALTDITVLLLPGASLRTLLLEYPVIAVKLLSDCCGYLRHLVNLVDDLALTTVQGRLARLLLAQAEADQNSAPPLTQAEIAARLGTVREMVGRSLKTLEGLGLIRIERGVIIILDRAGLERECGD